MDTLKSLVILSLVLVVATGRREKRSSNYWCRAFGCPPEKTFKNRGGSLNKENWRGIPQTFQAPEDITTRDKMDSEMENGKSASSYRYEDTRDYLKELS